MKKIIVIIICLFLVEQAFAGHITGGEMYYTYTGFSNGRHQYSVTMKYYKRCGVTADFPDITIVSVFDKTTNSRYQDIDVALTRLDSIGITNFDPCISNPPQVCFVVATYTFTLSVPTSPGGYILSSLINFRIAGINNLVPGYSAVGATFTGEIPGDSPIRNAPQNSSARFVGSDLVLVCSGNTFSYSFRAVDPDGDELYYSFCEAYNSTASGGGTTAPSEPPPYPPVPYATPVFSASQPLGPGITLNNTTGLIQGVAPAPGVYVVKVCVEEIRRGQVIAVQKKDIQINVADCSIAEASLDPEYSLCGSTQTIVLSNKSNSPVITATNWEITDRAGNPVHLFSGAQLNYSFADTGLYHVKLVINRNLTCADSTTALIRVYPGFVPGFDLIGGCVTKLTSFFDQSSSVYGIPDSWNWDFGEASTALDISDVQNPVYSYPTTGPKTIRLIATDSKGCRDTATRTLDVTTGPPLSVLFRDTLICISDNLVLQATGTGNFSWTPAATLSDPASSSPQASPAITTTYYVNLNNGGCTNRDSVRVRVVNFVTLLVSDTTICSGDTTQLNIISDGLQYSWTPAPGLLDLTAKNPRVIPPSATAYTVTALIGGCNETRTLTVTPVPYPLADAGDDIAVCPGNPAQLNGTTDGSSWNWSPSRFLDDPTVLSPLANPSRTTPFILAAYDTRGCPKAGLDTVVVTVLPKPSVSAGRDTAVIVGEQLQLNAMGALDYQWSPPFNLSADDIPDPIAIFNTPSAGLQYRVTGVDSAGCSASAFIIIKVFQTGPTVFVPTAFTPDNNGLNDLLKPFGAGIRSISYFQVYNRWGQLVFQTQQNGRGWDGNWNGQPQPTGTYVWQVKATDHRGNPYFQKGVFTLIR